MDERIQELRSSKLAEGFDRILVPGEIEFETEIQRKKEGIPILCAIIDELNRLAEHLNVQNHL